MELILIMILTLIMVPLALLTTGLLRIVFGLLFILFFPGYTLMTALFPKKESLDAIERIALSFGLSIAVASLLALVLNYTPWGIRLEPILIGIAVFIFIASVIGMYRRLGIPEGQKFEPHLRIKLPGWGGWSKMNKALLGALIISIIASIGAVAYAVATPKVGESFTEFYSVGPGGMAGDYPQELALGEEGTIIVGIVNHEHQATAYSIEVRIDGEQVQEIGPISLAHEEKWEEPVTFVLSKAGEDLKVKFLLYRDDESEPYRELDLRLDVKETPSPTEVIVFSDDFEGDLSKWNDNGGTDWDLVTDRVHNGSISVWAGKEDDGYLTSDNIDLSDATEAHLDFWINKYDTDSTDITLYFYDSSSYNLITELDGLGGDDVWLNYDGVSIDIGTYGISNFRISFDATLGNQESAWIDELVLTKIVP